MRKYQQQQILELIKTLDVLIFEIKRLISRKELQSAMQIIENSQVSAAQLGSFIERLEGKDTQTGSYLEEYCELLQQAGIKINNKNGDTGFVKKLKKQLVQIENSVRNELKPNKIEMVFIPYKAAMWDSLESIWLAAKDDPACDAYVIPVPYYDKLPGGELGQLHYEGGQYPGYVPVVDWRNYNMEERRPDVIFTHNPYDNSNFVTSIHPDYYNKRLKNFTELLVYVPYFVCFDDVEEHFCVCAGTLYADRVIVQSGKIRDTYIRVFKEFEKANGVVGKLGNPEKKFLALGSPKFDKVIKTKREDYKIPEDWKRLIKKPDGSQKKVILYNTSLSCLLHGNEMMLRKLRDIFDYFRKQPDVILWWRPHPLNESAYLSMRSRLYKEYLAIIDEYRRQGFGIYDDTADLHRAIAMSDAYYGDWSSLVAMYQCTGKPVMIQNFSLLSSDSYTLVPRSVCDDGENIWIVPHGFNALFKIDKSGYEFKYVCSLPYGHYLHSSYNSIDVFGDKLYLAPLCANEIVVYDIQCRQIQKIPLKEKKTWLKFNLDFKCHHQRTVCYKQWIFFIPDTYTAFVRYDPQTGQVDYFSDWLENLHELAKQSPAYNDKVLPETKWFAKDDFIVSWGKNSCVNGSQVAVTYSFANAVLIFDMDSCTSKIYEVGDKNARYNTICFDGKNYWLVSRYKALVIKWNPETNEYKEIIGFPQELDGDRIYFISAVYANGFVWLFPYTANLALKINVENDAVSIAEEFQDGVTKKTYPGINYIMGETYGDIIYAFNYSRRRNNYADSMLIKYNAKTGQKLEYALKMSDEDLRYTEPERAVYFKKDIPGLKTAVDCCFLEFEYASINDYINLCLVNNDNNQYWEDFSKKQLEICSELFLNTAEFAGDKIYAKIKQIATGEGL